jgi:hypothetical protein
VVVVLSEGVHVSNHWNQIACIGDFFLAISAVFFVICGVCLILK